MVTLPRSQSAREAYIAFLNSIIKGEIHVHSGGRLKGSKLLITNDVEKLEKIWIVPKGSRMPKADQVLINSPDMIPAADFSINHKDFTQDCTARIEKMMNLLFI
jgi:hypothetical protein